MRNKYVIVNGIAKHLAEILLLHLRREGYAPVITADELVYIEYCTGEWSGDDLQIPADFRERNEPLCVDGWLRNMRRRGGHLNALVTGLSSDFASLENGTPEIFSDSLGRNLRNSYGIIRKLIPYLIQAKGSIVIVGDATSMAGQGYIAAEGAMLGILPTLAAELFTSGVRLNALVPGEISNENGSEFFNRSLDVQNEPELGGFPKITRGGDTEEIARMVLFLMSPRSHVNGEIIFLNGGHLRF